MTNQISQVGVNTFFPPNKSDQKQEMLRLLVSGLMYFDQRLGKITLSVCLYVEGS